jgi:chemotaxis protein methyltransferase CheR
VRRGDRRLAIWCAACAAGQEPYSVALLLRENFPELASWTVSLIASDVSKEMLAKAKEGKYNQIEVNRGLPATLLVKYFKQQGSVWQLNEDVRRQVDFREINLCKAWPVLPQFDLILIRNVMIYFEPEVKKTILGKMAKVMGKDGYLLLGSAETTVNLDPSYHRVPDLKTGFYTRPGG